jgi:hypothetical protein
MGEQFDEAVQLSSIARAITRNKRGVSKKAGVMDYYIHRITKAKGLRDDILSGRYKLRPGRPIKITYPKPREANAPWLPDRAWQRSMCDAGLYNDLTKHLLQENVACQTGKGTDLAIRLVVKWLRKLYQQTGSNEIYGVHLDIRGYFPNTPHGVVWAFDKSTVSEPMFLPYLHEIIYNAKDKRPMEVVAADPFGPRGTELGSPINQLSQVALLNDVQHKIKDICPGCVIYMDDYLLLSADKSAVIRATDVARDALAKKGLELKDGGVFRASDGFYFLKKRFILTDTGKVVIRMRPGAAGDERRQLRALKEQVDTGICTMADVEAHYQSFAAQVSYCTGTGFIRAMDKYYTELFRRKPNYKYPRRDLYGNHMQRKKAAPPRAAEKRSAPGGVGKDEGHA